MGTIHMKKMEAKKMEAKKMKKERQKRMKAGVIIGFVLIATVVFGSVVVREQINPETGTATMKISMGNAVAEYSPGAGDIESGWLEIYIYPHDGSPAATYAENTSATLEAASLAYADVDSFSETLVSETSFDIVVRGRWNQTNAYNFDQFEDTRCRIKITADCDDWAVGAAISDVEGTLVISQNSSTDDFIWCNVYWNNAAAGYQIKDGATLTITEISIEAEF